MNSDQSSIAFIASQLRKPSGDFAQTVGKFMNDGNEFLYDFVLGAMKLKDGDKVLEIGFGNGKFFDKLLARAAVTVTGIDYSPEMVAAAQAYNTAAIEQGRLTVQTAGSDHIPYPDNTFDVVFCNMVIFFWDKPADHLREIARVLKPGGSFYTGIRTRASMAQLPFTRHGFKLYDNHEWQEVLERNGFVVEDVLQKPGQHVSLPDGSSVTLDAVCFVAKA